MNDSSSQKLRDSLIKTISSTLNSICKENAVNKITNNCKISKNIFIYNN